MSNLRLGTVNLDPRDTAFVRALVRLFAHTEKLSWSFADAPPYHAVVTDTAARTACPGFFAGFDGLVLTLVDGAGAPALDTVAFPIRANQFRDWLKERQAGLLDILYRVETPAPIAAASAPVAAASVDSDAGRRFKLRRWPGAALLRGDPVAMRMATFMSRNAMTTVQLAALTQQPEDRARGFVAALREAGLLLELVALDSAGAAVQAQQAAPAAAMARTGLMASLRRRLGLQEKA